MGHRWSLWILLALAGLFVLAVNDHWAVKSDSALYLGLGRSLAEGRGMMFNGRAEWGVPPVVPLLVAGCRLLAGAHDWLPNLCMTMFGLGVVVFSYLAVRHLAADLPGSLRDTVALGSPRFRLTLSKRWDRPVRSTSLSRRRTRHRSGRGRRPYPWASPKDSRGSMNLRS